MNVFNNPPNFPEPITPPIIASVEIPEEPTATSKALEAVPQNLRGVYTGAIAARLLVGELEAEIVAHIVGQNSYYDFANARSYLNSIAQSDMGQRLAHAKAVLSTLEASPDFLEARRIIEPLLRAHADETEKADKALQDLRQKAQAHREQMEAAHAQALARAEQDADFLAAKKKHEQAAAVASKAGQTRSPLGRVAAAAKQIFG